MGSASDSESITELQWAHQTLIRLIRIIQMNALATDQLRECLVSLTQSAVLLEGLIQAYCALARRRRLDEQRP